MTTDTTIQVDDEHEAWWWRLWHASVRILQPAPSAEFRSVSRHIYDQFCKRGEGLLYAVLPDGLHEVSEYGLLHYGPFFEDEGLPYCHLRCAAYVAPFQNALMGSIEDALKAPEAFCSASIPESAAAGTILRKRGYRAFLTIRVNTADSFALLLKQLRNGCTLKDRNACEADGHDADESEGTLLSGEITINPGWFHPGDPGYYCWREGDILVMSQGVYDSGT